MAITATEPESSPSVRHGTFSRLWEYRDLVKNLVAKDIKVRYMGAALGFAWSLGNPLILFATYFLVFTYIFPSKTPHYALYLITGILHWNLFAMNTAQASEMLVSNASLMKKLAFPRVLIPLANLLVHVVLWLAAMCIYGLLYPWLGGPWSWALLAYPAYMILYLAFLFGLSLTLAVLYVDFRDLKHIVEVMLMVLFWASPVVYPLKLVPAQFRTFYLLNPLTQAVVCFDKLLYSGQMPNLKVTACFALWAVAALGLGLYLLHRRGPRLIERL